MSLPQGAFAGISSGGYRDKQQNDRKFIAWFKYEPYEEIHEIPYFTKFNDEIPSKEQLDTYLGQFVNFVQSEVNELVLVEFWTKFILKFIYRFRKESFPPTINIAETTIRNFCIEKYRDLETELNNLIARQVQKVHPFKLADKIIQEFYNRVEAKKDDNFMVE